MSPASRRAASILAIMLTAPGPAVAQYVDAPMSMLPARPARPSTAASVFRRDREQAVTERMLEGFSAVGLPLGGLVAYPGLVVSPAFISNPLANDDRQRSIAALVLDPDLTLRNSAGPIDAEAYVRGKVTRVSRLSTENTEQVSGGLQADAEVATLTSLYGGGSYGARVLPRYASDSPVDARKPLEYRQLQANLGARREQGRFRVSIRGDLERLRFSNGERAGGGALLAEDRDRTVLRGLARLDYALRPNASVYLAATGNRIDYRLSPPIVPIRRDSKGWGAFVGTSIDLSSLIRADVRLGYIRQVFATSLRSVSGLGLNGKLEYFPTRLTTLTVSGEREVRDSGVPGTGGYVHSGGTLRVDHELRRYLIASVLGGYERDVFRGVTRRERDLYAGLTGTYLSGHGRSLRLGYQYSERQCVCSSVGASFKDHRAFAALTLRY